jgi:hypothetical protein
MVVGGVGSWILILLSYTLTSHGVFDLNHPPFFYNFFVSIFFASVFAWAAWAAKQIPSDIAIDVFGERCQTGIYAAIIVAVYWIIAALSFLMYDPTTGSLSVGSFFYMLFIYLPLTISKLFTLIIFPFVIGAVAVFIAPYTIMGIVALRTTTPTAEIAQEQARTEYPSGDIEARLAAAMEGELASDDEMTKLISQLSILERIKYTYLYKLKQKKLAEVNELLRAQEEKIREQTKAAHAAHSYERTKRGDH